MASDVFFDLPEWHDLPRRVIPIPELGLPPKNNAEYPEFYERVIRRRIAVYQAITNRWTGHEALQHEADLCRLDGRYWVNVHVGIYESRVDEDDDGEAPRSFLTPFVLYPFQDYIWGWIEERFRTTGRLGDGILIKSRDMGVTNLVCAYFSWRWFATAPFQGRLLSRRENLVDDSGSTDSMMWKIEYFLKSTHPALLKLLVPGFRWHAHRQQAKLLNPENANALTGESTNSNAGRGARCTGMALDEFTVMRNLRAIWQSSRAATRHRILMGTVSTQEGMTAHDLVEDSLSYPAERKPAILRVYNSLHPLHDAAWLARERERDSDEGIQQEIFMNWFANESDFVFPAMGPKTVGDFPYLPYQGQLFCAIDDGINDDWAMLWIQYIQETGRHRVIESYKNRGQIAKFYGTICTGIFDSQFHYGQRERDLMDKTRDWEPPIYVGDPHGRNIEQTTGLSPHDILAQEFGIEVNIDHNKTDTIQKIQAVGDIIDRLDWNDTPNNRVALQDCKRYRWRQSRDGRELQSETREPMHGRDSHSPQALMFYAVNWRHFRHILTGQTVIYYQDDYERISNDPEGDAVYAREALERQRMTYDLIR